MVRAGGSTTVASSRSSLIVARSAALAVLLAASLCLALGIWRGWVWFHAPAPISECSTGYGAVINGSTAVSASVQRFFNSLSLSSACSVRSPGWQSSHMLPGPRLSLSRKRRIPQSRSQLRRNRTKMTAGTQVTDQR